MDDNDFDKAMHAGSWAAWQAMIATKIAAYGQMLIGVFNSPDDEPSSPGFAYTIGLKPIFGYEIIVFGLPYDFAGGFLNELGDRIRAGEKFGPDSIVKDLANLPLLLKLADERARGYVCQADRYYEENVPTLQLVLPDKNGTFPGSPGYDTKYMSVRQPLLYNP